MSLSDRLKYANQIIDQLLKGLFQMYHRGILHRDIKPGNIFIDYDYDQTQQTLVNSPRCYYGDFGLARQFACNAEYRHDRLDIRAYTINYRPPEVMVGRTDYTDKADLWALGATLVEYFSGEAAFRLAQKVIDRDAILMVLPKLHNPPLVNQYAQYKEQIKQNTMHYYVDVQQILANKPVPTDITTLLTQLLQVNPDDRPSITTLVANQMACPRPPTLLSRGSLSQKTEITMKMYYILVNQLIEWSETKQLQPKILIVCVDMLDRYLAHYHTDQKDLQLIGLTLLLIATSMVNFRPDFYIDELVYFSNHAFTDDQFKAKELELIRQLNYTFLSCDIDPYVNYFERQMGSLAEKYEQLRQTYKKIESKGLYVGDLSYDQIMSYLD